MVDASHGLQQGDVRIGEPRDPAIRFSLRFRFVVGHRSHQESFHLEHHRTNCLPGAFSSVPLMVLLLVFSLQVKMVTNLIVLFSGQWPIWDRATGLLFLRMTYSFVDQVLV